MQNIGRMGWYCLWLGISTFTHSEIEHLSSVIPRAARITENNQEVFCCSSNAALDALTQSLCSTNTDIIEKLETITTIVENIDDDVDECCDTINNQLTTVHSTIVNTVVNTVGDLEDNLDTCCTTLNTKADTIITTVNNIEDIVEEIDTDLAACCTTINNTLSIISTTVNTIEDIVEEIDTDLDTCCTTLNTNVDTIIATVNNIEDIVEEIDTDLDTCCTTINNTLSTISTTVNNIEDSVETIDTNLDTCCTTITTTLTTINTTVNAIDSDLSTCCTTINNRLDTIENTLEILQDTLEACCQVTCDPGPAVCCSATKDIQFLTSTTTTHAINSLDWSFDNQYVALGLAVLGVGNNKVEIFSFDGSALAFEVADADILISDIQSVRFSPTNYRLAVVRALTGNGEIRILEFNPAGPSLNTLSSINLAVDAVAVAWDPTGNYILVGTNTLTSGQVRLYSVNSLTGALTQVGATLTLGLGVFITSESLDWNPMAPYAALGVIGVIGLVDDLYIIAINGSPFTGISVATSIAVFTLGVGVSSLDWHPTGTFLAVGSLVGAVGDLLKVYSFNTTGPTLTLQTSLSGLNSVLALDWDPITGDMLSFANNFNVLDTSIFENYCFVTPPSTLSDVEPFDSGLLVTMGAVRWSPNETYIATGNGDGTLSVYEFLRLSCQQAILKLLCDLKTCLC